MPEVPATELSAGDIVRLDDPPGEWRIDVIHARRDDGVVASGYLTPTAHAPSVEARRFEAMLITGAVDRCGSWVD